LPHGLRQDIPYGIRVLFERRSRHP
jgi:hypothetical protein